MVTEVTATRFGLLGTGSWAADVHGAALAAHPRTVLAGVWGRDPARAAALADRHGSRVYEDVEALIADVDAVAIALPPHIQAPLAEMAARAGRHLLLDKPLGLSLPAADAVVDAVRDAGVASVIFFTRRYTSLVEEFIAKLIRTGGWIGSRTVHFGAIFQPGSPFGRSRWRREKGGLWDVGPHALGTLLPVLGPVVEVYATEGPGQVGYLTARHGSGAVSTLALSVDVPPAAVAGNGIEFFGEAGLVAVPQEDLDLGRVVGAYRVAIDQLLATIESGGTHPCDVRFGREVVAILTAGEKSYATGAAVPVDRPGSYSAGH